MTDKIDTTNKFWVGKQRDGYVIAYSPRLVMTREEALNLAAWLVAMADTDNEFPAVLAAVKNT